MPGSRRSRGAPAEVRQRCRLRPRRGRGFPLFADTPERRQEPSDPALRWAVPLTLIAGPANAGKVALLLERYLGRPRARAGSDRAEPVGRRPRRARAPRAARRRSSAGSIGTFDDLFERLARARRRAPGRHRRQRALLVARARSRRRVAERPRRLRALRRASPTRSCDAIARARVAALLDPDELDGDLGRLYAAYRAELDRLGALGPRPAPRAAPSSGSQSRPRRVARRAGLRLRLRGPDRRRVARCSRRSPAAPR